MMRLRQICLVAENLHPAGAEICDVLGLDICYRDPGLAKWGLVNAVMAVSGNFLEVVSPKKEGTSAGRYLQRRGGDGGYMTILQCADAAAERKRIAGMGIRTVWETDQDVYTATHFHPRDTGGPLLSLDSVEPGADFREPYCSWEPAGPNWPREESERGVELAGVDVQSGDPAALAARWSEILGLPLGEGEVPAIELLNGLIRFVPDTDGRGEGIAAVLLSVKMRDAVLEAAEARQARLDDDTIRLAGTVFRIA